MLSSFGERAMKALENNTGEGIQAKYVVAGRPQLVVGELESVSRFRFIMVRSLDVVEIGFHKGINSITINTSPLKIPFIGIKIAIQRIEKGWDDGEAIYDNFLIRDDYNLANPAKVLELAELLYGQNG